MNDVKTFFVVLGLSLALFGTTLPTYSAADGLFDVTVTGEVEFNQINAGFLGNVNPGDQVTLSFQVDGNNFVDSMNFPTRGYEIDQSSFALDFNGSSIGLQNPFPAGQTPFFVLRNNDPAVDGFFVSTNVDFPVGVPIDQAGIFEQFSNNFSVTYENDPLSSLNIEDAVGEYDFTGLSVFGWTVNDGPFEPLGIVFNNLTISSAGAVPEPGVVLPLVCLGSLAAYRRRRL